MENEIKLLKNNEKKAKFFAQYWGVKCLKNELLNELIPAQKVDKSNCNGLPQQFLELKPLSQISNEDTEHVMELENFINGFLSDDILNYLIDLKKGKCNKIEVIDYLRSKGYALPYMDLSVKDLIEYGWVKLKEN